MNAKLVLNVRTVKLPPAMAAKMGTDTQQAWSGNTYPLYANVFKPLADKGKATFDKTAGVWYTFVSNDEIAAIKTLFQTNVVNAPASDMQINAIQELVDGGFAIEPDYAKLSYKMASAVISEGRALRKMVGQADATVVADAEADATEDALLESA